MNAGLYALSCEIHTFFFGPLQGIGGLSGDISVGVCKLYVFIPKGGGFCMAGEKRYLKISEAAAMIGCSSQTLRNYQLKGLLVPEIIFESGQRRYSVSQIEKFIQEQMVAGV